MFISCRYNNDIDHMFISSTILLGTRKMVRIGGIGLALSDKHFVYIRSRDCFNLSREYFSLWAIKTSLDIFTRRSSFSLSSLLQTTGRYFSKICAIHRLNRLVLHALKLLRIFIVRGYWRMPASSSGASIFAETKSASAKRE